MATIKYKIFPKIGKGVSIETSIIPPAGLIPVIYASRNGVSNLFRYSKDGGKTYTDWENFSKSILSELGKFTDSCNLIFDYIIEPYNFYKTTSFELFDEDDFSSTIYDKTIFKTFFNSNDPQVLLWAVNVLEKLFEPGIVPLYVNRNNENDYNTFFLTITHYFAFVVIYARQFRQLENSDILMKEFIEGWGLVYENIDSLDQRQYIFNNWIKEFYKRGTQQIAETGGTIEGELRRLVGYSKPSEFIFATLSSQDVGWCLGWSSPTWYGTETVNGVSKGWDYGPDYAGEVANEFVHFSEDEIRIDKTGSPVENEIQTEYPWDIYIGEDVPVKSSEFYTIGVGPLKDYPILGDVKRKFVDNIYVFQPTGTGRVGVSSEADKEKVMEIYPGLDYEVTIWVRALGVGDQNIEFGVNCYDSNFELINQVRITDWAETNSFFAGERYQSPCKVPGIYYQLRGVVYSILSEKSEDLYLNFENGRPLRFVGDVRYMAPYIVQNRDLNSVDIQIAGIVLKPFNLPFSQGYLGQKNVIAMYAQIKSARTKLDIEKFVKRYLVSYKNVVSYVWLDYIGKTSYFLTFNVKRKADNSPIEGASIVLSNGLESKTDLNGYVRFEISMDSVIYYTISFGEAILGGKVVMSKNQTINVEMEAPVNVSVETIGSDWGTAIVEGSCVPGTNINLIAKPNDGFHFRKWRIISDLIEEDYHETTQYWVGDNDIKVQAIFERNN